MNIYNLIYTPSETKSFFRRIVSSARGAPISDSAKFIFSKNIWKVRVKCIRNTNNLFYFFAYLLNSSSILRASR